MKHIEKRSLRAAINGKPRENIDDSAGAQLDAALRNFFSVLRANRR